MTSKQRAYLKGIAMVTDPCLNIGKDGIEGSVTDAVLEAIDKRELVKLNVLKNCMEDIQELARVLSERTHSEVVQVIGRRIVLYKPAKKKEDRRIVLPK
ncbi:MAG: YhbY family RNA-binding protein [Lachnospiraceae bacterium]|nr:YhbY family RNA-binding protein [Lachnospiraceae bacterium]